MKKFQKLTMTNSFAGNNYWLVVLLTLVFFSCKKEISPEENAATNEISALERNGKSMRVHSGGSIQDAVNNATSGTTIIVEPGIYKESIRVNKPDIQIIGLSNGRKEIIIENPGTEEDGIDVTTEGDGFVLKNVTVKGFLDNGVLLTGVDNFVLEHVKAINNKEYGLFPVFCNHGVIKFCSATGSSDTGIYVGQSENIQIEHNEAYANVSGFEIENCTNVIARWNESYDNAAGLLVFLLPGLTVKTSTNIEVSNNNIHDNNHVNFAPPGGGFEVFIPSGSGILLVGTDNTSIEKNTIRNNNFVGIATVSTLVLASLAGIPPEAITDIEPNPDGVTISKNKLTQNGSAVPPGLPLPAADLLWDGSGNNNCWKNNVFASSYPASLPTCN